MEQVQAETSQQLTEKASRLRFVFRVAFICNIFFIVCMILRYSNAPQHIWQPLIGLSIILGWIAPLVNIVSFVLALILISQIRNRKIPLWLLYTNIICFILQIYFFFILHD